MSKRKPLELARAWLVSESRRTVVATGIAAALVVPTLRFAEHLAPGFSEAMNRPTDASLVVLVLMCTYLALMHTALTWFAFSTSDRELFARRVATRTPRKTSTPWVDIALGRDQYSWPIATSMVALVVVCALNFNPNLRAVPLALAIGLTLVAVSWANVAMVFALNYARADLHRDALEFPGHADATLPDYLYFAIAVQATFGATDVSVLNTPTRRIVTAQSVLAFIFNTVIVGMIISLLVGTT